MKLTIFLLLGLLACLRTAGAETFLVENGLARAEIVIAEQPPRMVKLAATELQSYLQKISGATLPIKTAPSSAETVVIYIGKSPQTDRLKLTGDELRDGGFHMVSGERWLAFLGRDRDYEPREPAPHDAKDMPRVLQEWDKLTGEHWDLDLNLRQSYKMQNKELGGIREQDERGSLNAVYEFLRGLGVRWYLPGEIGEIVPKLASIALPKIDQTVKPDFALRYPYIYGHRFGGSAEETLWQLRLGLSQAVDLIGPGYVAHGTTYVHAREEVKAAHPEFYTLVQGRRDTAERGKPCLSSPGLLAENVKFVRAMFDHFDLPVVSVMPADGYTAMCECELCQGKETPERGHFGRFSDYTWAYVNEVAKEVIKTHPDRKIVCMAYGASVLPPLKIDKLSPNIIVCMGQGRASLDAPDRREWVDEIRRGWLAKLPAGSRQFCVYDYYLHPRPTREFQYIPVYFPHAIANDLRSLKGISFGDYIEVYREKGLDAFGVNDLNLYITTRLWWDAGQDVDALIDEYCSDLYGPAREEMKAFIAYCEAHWAEMSKSPEIIAQTFTLLGAAQRKTAADSIEAKRIGLVADYIRPLVARREQMLRSAGRESARAIRINEKDGSQIKIDGQLDEDLWKKLSGYQMAELSNATTGQPEKRKTRMGVFWSGDSLYFNIRCDDPDVAHLQSTGSANDDPHILDGDYVELLFETQSHRFYQIAVNPAGLVYDADHMGVVNPAWTSGAKIAAAIGEKSWSVEVRLPVSGDLQAALDPLYGVAGRKPAGTYPWYFNLCRQRVRDGKIERSAFTPVERADFLDPGKFGRLNGYQPPAVWEEEKKRQEAQKTGN